MGEQILHQQKHAKNTFRKAMNRFEGTVKHEIIIESASTTIVPAEPENPEINSRLQSLDAMYSL